MKAEANLTTSEIDIRNLLPLFIPDNWIKDITAFFNLLICLLSVKITQSVEIVRYHLDVLGSIKSV